jgi:hypothetical protein
MAPGSTCCRHRSFGPHRIVSDYYEHRAEATLFGVWRQRGQPAWVETLLATYRIRMA